MQYARCTVDNKVWEASHFEAIPKEQLEIKRRSLICEQCGEFAWFRKESSHGHPAHFCAHHKDDCGLRVEYIVVDDHRDEATVADNTVGSSDAIIVQLDQERGDTIDVTEVKEPPAPGVGEGGKRHVLKGEGFTFAQHFTLRKILFRLVQSPDFQNSNKQIAIYRNKEEVFVRGGVQSVVSNFADISSHLHDNQSMLFWGPIASAGKTKDGKLWLNSSEKHQSASISIFPDIVEDFLRIFKIDDLEDLAGAHVLVAGNCYISRSTGKPVIWCASPKYIVLRRYRDEKLRVEL